MNFGFSCFMIYGQVKYVSKSFTGVLVNLKKDRHVVLQVFASYHVIHHLYLTFT